MTQSLEKLPPERYPCVHPRTRGQFQSGEARRDSYWKARRCFPTCESAVPLQSPARYRINSIMPVRSPLLNDTPPGSASPDHDGFDLDPSEIRFGSNGMESVASNPLSLYRNLALPPSVCVDSRSTSMVPNPFFAGSLARGLPVSLQCSCRGAMNRAGGPGDGLAGRYFCTATQAPVSNAQGSRGCSPRHISLWLIPVTQSRKRERRILRHGPAPCRPA
jgi:hypothetical protein